MMRKHLYLIFMLLLSVQMALAQKYEYWLDNGYDSRTTASYTSADVAFDVDISQEKPGVHFVNVRLQDAGSTEWGGIARYLFFVQGLPSAASTVTKYEYWLDNNYDSRTTTTATAVESPISVDLSNAKPGVHFFNFRTYDSNGNWSGIARYLFFVQGTPSAASTVTKYEYWLDNDFGSRTSTTATTVASPLSVDVSQLRPGVHFFNFRSYDSNGNWSGIVRYLFFINRLELSNDSKLAQVEFWIDEDRANLVKQEVKSDTITLTMNITDLPKGDHTLSVYGTSAGGEYLLFSRLDFNAPNLPVVPKPVVTHSGDTIIIKNGEGAETEKYAIEYHYTLDGSTPTSKSMKYEKAFVVTRNDTLKVIGIQYAHENSELAELVVDWFKVTKPTGSQKGNMLTLNCSTAKATIYYKLGDGEEMAYSSTVRLPDQLLVTAVARRDGYNDSEPLIIQTRQVKSAKPVATYDGHYLRITSGEEGVNLYYTLDGSSPANGLDVASTAKSYEGRMTIDTLCTLKAVAIIDSMNVSDVLTYNVDYVYNGKAVYVNKAGTLSNAFEWYGGTDKIEQLNIEGTLNYDDVYALTAMPVLSHLDMSNVKMSSGQLPADGFAGAQMISFVGPKELTSVGGRLFADCPRLAAVVWNADVTLKDNTFEGVNNPNLLLYVKKSSYKPAGISNVVIDGVASKITLKDNNAGNANFHCPQAFTANEINYTHEYKQKTAYGVTQGWETLALPFTVQSIAHETHGDLKPFDAEGVGKPFWLMKLEDDGLKYATTIEANLPYVISMPNNPSVYSDEYNQAGKITFSAKKTVVPVTEPKDNSSEDLTLTPVFQKLDKANGVYALNVGEKLDDNPEGSVFKSDYRDIRPFEAYLIHYGRSAARVIALSSMRGGDGTTGIEDLIMRKDENANDIVRVYSLSGALIKQGKRGEILKNLPRGIYIVDGKKIIK